LQFKIYALNCGVFPEQELRKQLSAFVIVAFLIKQRNDARESTANYFLCQVFITDNFEQVFSRNY
jgi:hypothetical protein